LFEEFEKAQGTDRKAKIADTICTELMIHAQIEEEVFYRRSRARSTTIS